MALIICCSPAAADALETMSSLRFGSHIKDILPTMQVIYRPSTLARLKISRADLLRYLTGFSHY